jgi:hypothetical protein
VIDGGTILTFFFFFLCGLPWLSCYVPNILLTLWL